MWGHLGAVAHMRRFARPLQVIVWTKEIDVHRSRLSREQNHGVQMTLIFTYDFVSWFNVK